jgi:hypothetical protein
MFTTYAKIVGLEYLWNALAMIMYELNALAAGKCDCSLI